METDEEYPIMNVAGDRLYVFGSARLEKIIPALRTRFTVLTHDDVASEPLAESVPLLEQLEKFGRMVATLRRHRPAVLVDAVGARALVVGLICRLLGLPFLLRLRGGMEGEFRDRAHDDSTPVRLFYGVGKPLIRDAVVGLAHGVIAVSHSNRYQLIKETDIDPASVHVAYLPVSPERFDQADPERFRDDLSLDKDAKVLFTATNFNYRDKYAALVYYAPVVEELLRECKQWHFVVAGGGSSFEAGRAAIRGQFSEDVRDRICCLGYYEDIEAAFAASDVSVHLSFRDSMGMTVLEAQAAGTPVVVNSAGGLPELVPDNGVIDAVVDTPDDLRSSLSELIHCPAVRKRVGTADKAWVTERFSTERIGAAFDAAITEAIDEWMGQT